MLAADKSQYHNRNFITAFSADGSQCYYKTSRRYIQHHVVKCCFRLQHLSHPSDQREVNYFSTEPSACVCANRSVLASCTLYKLRYLGHFLCSTLSYSIILLEVCASPVLTVFLCFNISLEKCSTFTRLEFRNKRSSTLCSIALRGTVEALGRSGDVVLTFCVDGPLQIWHASRMPVYVYRQIQPSTKLVPHTPRAKNNKRLTHATG